MVERFIRYRENRMGGTAWAVGIGDEWSLYNRHDVWIGDVKSGTGSYFYFEGSKDDNEEQRFVSFCIKYSEPETENTSRPLCVYGVC